MTETPVSEVTAWAIPEIPGMWLQILGYQGNLAAKPEHEPFFAPGYLECIVHYKERMIYAVFVARFAGEETVTPTSDTHRFFLLAHNEQLEAISVSLTGRILHFWGKYTNLETNRQNIRFLTLTDCWEG
jgi:hypothetical protein